MIRLPEPVPLDCGAELSGVEIGYESWGRPESEEVVLLCHSLTRDCHAAATSQRPQRGWWQEAIGPGAMFDTDRFRVIAMDTLSAGVSTGPASRAGGGRPYGSRFPVVTVADMVRAHRAALAELGVQRLHCVAGGCFGGQQALQWAISFPDVVERQIAIAVTPTTSAHSLAIFAAMRELIRDDPAWCGGDYYGTPGPVAGLGRAVMAAMPLWMSRSAMEDRFGRRRVDGAEDDPLAPAFAVEKFLVDLRTGDHGGIDANALMYLTRAVSVFDLPAQYGSLDAALRPVTADTLLVSYAGDWRYPSEEVGMIHNALVAGGARSQHLVVDSRLGHGGFMYDAANLADPVSAFLAEGVRVQA